ncbi:hypothetical protein [Hymenobacter wooponensis]|uniref:Uncharacterized protein n=1 Tax=Hymenobacter wooponensis TaxID=1525360 RepID=A0A4Z0MTB5_9BACT|nr:hypothetical protein [Hymenobacter wooponensis]TGD82679.1 hypothetical protein EU557_02540 [Hymenobacter wooponensis]
MLTLFIRYAVLATSCWLLVIYPLAAQPTPKVFPLHRFFQAHYDSTIIYQRGSSWNNSPNYLILAKLKDQVYFFTYASPYQETRGRYFPGGLVQKFSREELAFSRAVPDTNRYFLPGRASAPALGHCWHEVVPAQLWQVQGDEHPRRTSGHCVIEDGDENTFYLIDKRAVKVTSFYAPAYYEECEGKNPNRHVALKTIAALQALSQ